MVVFKVFSTCKPIFKVDIKSLILPKLISLWCLYYNIWTRFYQLYVLAESEVVAPKSSIKKGVFKNSTKFTGKHLRWSIFSNFYKLIKYKIWYRCLPMNFAKSLRTSILQKCLQGPAFEE